MKNGVFKSIKLITYVVTFSFFTIFLSHIYADEILSEEYIKYLNLTDDQKASMDVVPRKEFVSYDDVYKNESNDLSVLDVKEEKLPEKFSLTEKVSIHVSNQDSSGWCWAYASLTSAETNYALKGYGSINLAEYHLAYMRLTNFGGWKNIAATDGMTVGQVAYSSGGSFYDFKYYVGLDNNYYGKNSTYGVIGAVSGQDSENKSYEITDTCISSFKSKQPSIKVTKVIEFPDLVKTYDSDGAFVSAKNGSKVLTESELLKNREAIKKQIYENGSVFAYTKITSENYNYETCALYTDDPNFGITHAVSIVGWDDNYSKENFKEGKQPANDGAYIALNSWGENWGNDGYFYISYDDANVEYAPSGVVSSKPYNNSPSVYIKSDGYSSKLGGIVLYLYSDEALENITGWTKCSSYDSLSMETVYKKVYTKNEVENISAIPLYGNKNSVATVNIDINDYFLKGDLNSDSALDVTDAYYLLNYIANNKSFNSIETDIADLDYSKSVDVTDAYYLLKQISGIN